VKLVVNGAGAAGIACVELIKAMGVPPTTSSCATPRA
jgi:malic enzyme